MVTSQRDKAFKVLARELRVHGFVLAAHDRATSMWTRSAKPYSENPDLLVSMVLTVDLVSAGDGVFRFALTTAANGSALPDSHRVPAFVGTVSDFCDHVLSQQMILVEMFDFFVSRSDHNGRWSTDPNQKKEGSSNGSVPVW